MSQPLVSVYYNGNLVKPVQSISYSTNMDYKNDLAVNYYYTVKLNGSIIPPPTGTSYTLTNLTNSMADVKGVFSSNGGTLKVYSDDKLVFYAVDSKVKGVNFLESSNNWSKYIPFEVEIDFNHLHMGEDLEDTLDEITLNGGDDLALADNFQSSNVVDIENYKIKEFTENFTMDINDNDIFNQVTLLNAVGVTSSKITNSFFSISYNLSAKGKHDIYYSDNNKVTLPAWEHAKRYVHRRLVNQLNSMFNTFLSMDNSGPLSDIHSYNNDGAINLRDPLGGLPAFGLFNETITFDVSEAEGTFSVQYNAIVKQLCPTYEINIGCSSNTIHTVSTQISRSFTANEETNLENQEITVTVNGEIRGLVPGGGGLRSYGPLVIADPDGPYRGTFLLRQNTFFDKNDYADQLLIGTTGVIGIFDPIAYDLTEPYKAALGITPDLLGVNYNTLLRPSKMNLTRNYLQGTINYTAEYNNKYNCSTSHFEVQLSVEMPTPVIAEFVIPNNNVERVDNDSVCASGYSVIQKLGTQTAKKISVNINGNLGFDLGKCCLGSQRLEFGSCDDSLDLLSLNYFDTQDFILPSGVVIPIIGSGYVLTNKQKSTTFPKGDFSITLDYICADVCEINYFEKK